MKRNLSILSALVLVALMFCSVTLSAKAHPGRTDSKGGHKNHSTGEYHYHHGYSPHDHYDMDGDGDVDCPYDFDDKTDRWRKYKMNDIFAYIFSIFVLIAIVAFGKWYKYSREMKLRDLVSWSALGDYCPALGINSYVRELLFTVLNAQCSDSIDKKYRITEEERKYVIEVIEEYQKDIMRSYFKGQNIVIKSKYEVRNEDYFMFTLYAFLSDNESTYSEKEFAVVFHKMHYITYMYCRSNDILRCLVPAWNENNLKEMLDTNKIQRR